MISYAKYTKKVQKRKSLTSLTEELSERNAPDLMNNNSNNIRARAQLKLRGSKKILSLWHVFFEGDLPSRPTSWIYATATEPPITNSMVKHES